jgi:hypothetical protein
MNEIELIRRQLSVERQHATDVARACASALAAAGAAENATLTGDRGASIDAFRAAGIEYLVWILSRFEEREQVFHDLLRKRFAADDPNRRAVEAALASSGSSREALARLEEALSATRADRWSEFLHFFTGAWSTRRDEIDRLFERLAKVPDWRTVAAIDADSIVDERSRYARVKATAPTDMEMSHTTVRV